MSENEYTDNSTFRGVRLGMAASELVAIFGTPDRVEKLSDDDIDKFEFPDNIVEYYRKQQSYQYVENGFEEPSISITIMDGQVVQVHQIDEGRPIIFKDLNLLHDEIEEVLTKLNEYGESDVFTDGDNFYFSKLGIVVSDEEPGERIVSFVLPVYMQKDFDDDELSPVSIEEYLYD